MNSSTDYKSIFDNLISKSNINLEISLIPTNELNSLRRENDEMKLRIADLIKDKEFMYNHILNK